MVCLVNKYNRRRHRDLIHRMHGERKNVFIDILHWDLPSDGASEADQFDDEHAQYLILHDTVSGDHQASMRLLRTDRPHLMNTVFGFLCEKGVPSGSHVMEITRLCLSPKLRAYERLAARNRLVRGMIEYGLISGISAFTAVCEMHFLQQILSAGWDVEPLGMPRPYGGKVIGAFQINLQEDTLDRLNTHWRCHEPALRIVPMGSALAA